MPAQQLGLGGILESIYEAAENPAFWPEALRMVAAWVDADAAAISRLEQDRLAFRPLVSLGCDEARRRRLRRICACGHPLLKLMEHDGGRIYTDADLGGAITDTPFFTEWMAPQRFAHCALISIRAAAAGVFVLELMRHGDGAPFGTEELDRLLGCLPHLARALRLAHRFDRFPRAISAGCGQVVPAELDQDHAAAHPNPIATEVPLSTWPEATKLRLLYRFTPTETEIAKLVLAGLSSHAMARRLQVSVNTVRTHLRHIYDKTGTNRQPELMTRLTHVRSSHHDARALQ